MKRKRRKRSPRPLRYRGRNKKPGVAAALKARWADPDYRERMSRITKERHAAKKAAGIDMSRAGIPDGMRRPEAEKLNKQAAESAKKTMAELKEAGIVNDNDAANEALEVSLTIMRAPGDKKVRLAAAKQVLEFTKKKPAQDSNVSLSAAEAWLAAITAEKQGDDDKGSTPGDAKASV